MIRSPGERLQSTGQLWGGEQCFGRILQTCTSYLARAGSRVVLPIDQMSCGGELSVNNFNEGLVGGYIQSAGSIAELAAKMELDPGRLENTVGRYNKDVADGVDREFGRSHALLPLDAPPYYIAATSNALTSTSKAVSDRICLIELNARRDSKTSSGSNASQSSTSRSRRMQRLWLWS